MCGLSLGGCATTESRHSPIPEPEVFAQPFNRPPDAPPEEQIKPTFGTYNPSASTIFPDYRLNIGDELEVIYHVRTGVSASPYRLKVQDVVSIHFPYQSQFDQDVTVQSDGTIRLLLVGEIQVVKRGEYGLSPFHFREDPEDQNWYRYNPEAKEWERYPYPLVRLPDGGWAKLSPDTHLETNLEDEIPADERTGMQAFACIVDAIGPTGRHDRYEYDQVQQRWKTRPIFVEQVGMTAEQLQDQLRKQYAKYLRDPELTVTVTQANIKIDELKKAITTAPRGQSRLMPIKPDGTIDLPFVGEVLAFGKTIQQLKNDVENAYAQVDLPEISVTVQMNKWAPLKIFVLGEVNAPGLLTVQTPITLLQAIAAAGGTNPRAAEDLVMVVRRKGLPVPEATVVNLRALLSKSSEAKAGDVPDYSNLRYDFHLTDSDIVYIPSTALAVAGDWVDLVFSRIIRSILPYQFYTGLNFGYDLHREPQVNKTDRGRWPNVNMQVGP